MSHYVVMYLDANQKAVTKKYTLSELVKELSKANTPTAMLVVKDKPENAADAS
jgi:hypothetical protein